MWLCAYLWFFRYLETESNYSENGVIVTMVTAVLVLAAYLVPRDSDTLRRQMQERVLVLRQ